MVLEQLKIPLSSEPFDDQFGIVGAAHSITKTNTRITGDVFRNIGIITTKTAHGLQIGDDFRLKFTGTTTDSYKIKLDTINRKVLVDDISFADSKVDLTTNSIDISGYSKYKKLKTGDKVVYYAATPITGLYNGKTYYILKDSTDKIKLCEFEADISTTSAVDLTVVGSGTAHMFHLINPPLDFFRGTIIEFDVSDTTLGFNLIWYSLRMSISLRDLIFLELTQMVLLSIEMVNLELQMLRLVLTLEVSSYQIVSSIP